MKVGVPAEIKPQESRVGLTPNSVEKLISDNHEVIIQDNAGLGAGFENSDYIKVGAKIASSAGDVFNDSDMIVKVKEPLSEEISMLRENQILFTYLHLSAAPDLTKGLVNSKAACIAYETVTDQKNRLPLLAPMSAVAGRMSIQAGARSLEKQNGGRGVLIGGAPGVTASNVLILGGGVVGENAAIIATGMQANVIIIDKSEQRLIELKERFGGKVKTLLSDQIKIEDYIFDCDMVIGGILVPGANAPKIITKNMIKEMKNGSVIVDVAIDQGGCVETSKPTTHANPTFVVDDVVHYCVANMPGGVPRTSTFALNAVTLPFVLDLANNGINDALNSNQNFMNGLNIYQGSITYEAVANDLKYEYVKPSEILN